MRISRKMRFLGELMVLEKEAHGVRCLFRASPEDDCRTCGCVCNDGIMDTSNEIKQYQRKLKRLTH